MNDLSNLDLNQQLIILKDYKNLTWKHIHKIYLILNINCIIFILAFLASFILFTFQFYIPCAIDIFITSFLALGIFFENLSIMNSERLIYKISKRIYNLKLDLDFSCRYLQLMKGRLKLDE